MEVFQKADLVKTQFVNPELMKLSFQFQKQMTLPPSQLP